MEGISLMHNLFTPFRMCNEFFIIFIFTDMRIRNGICMTFMLAINFLLNLWNRLDFHGLKQLNRIKQGCLSSSILHSYNIYTEITDFVKIEGFSLQTTDFGHKRIIPKHKRASKKFQNTKVIFSQSLIHLLYHFMSCSTN